MSQLNFVILDIYNTFQQFSFDRESFASENVEKAAMPNYRITKLNSSNLDDHLISMRELKQNLEIQLTS